MVLCIFWKPVTRLSLNLGPSIEVESGPLRKTFFFFLAELHGIWNLSSLTRDQTHTPCSGSIESKPLDHQGSPWRDLCGMRARLL